MWVRVSLLRQMDQTLELFLTFKDAFSCQTVEGEDAPTNTGIKQRIWWRLRRKGIRIYYKLIKYFFLIPSAWTVRPLFDSKSDVVGEVVVILGIQSYVKLVNTAIIT